MNRVQIPVTAQKVTTLQTRPVATVVRQLGRAITAKQLRPSKNRAEAGPAKS
ncbi:hypothetical protein [Deinococcus sp.]|uniref:hypothetical protein n=1 Tax=Deinococcus sp. TaxID=47478 RepID=UPI0025C1189D|nr:hypothetical protein [Deinococcus sp.]